MSAAINFNWLSHAEERGGFLIEQQATVDRRGDSFVAKMVVRVGPNPSQED
jgi:hypothetical protein